MLPVNAFGSSSAVAFVRGPGGAAEAEIVVARNARRRSALRALRAALCTLPLLLTPSAPTGAAAGFREAPEYTVKASYLLLFTRYVEWPTSAFASANAPIEILTLGSDPFGDVLDSTVAGTKRGGRAIIVRRATTLAAGERAHLVFFGAAAPDLQKRWLTELRDAPVLTVVDAPGALSSEAILTFVTETRRGLGRVRFDVNLPAMRRAGLRINSQMLASARRVVREPAPDASR